MLALKLLLLCPLLLTHLPFGRAAPIPDPPPPKGWSTGKKLAVWIPATVGAVGAGAAGAAIVGWDKIGPPVSVQLSSPDRLTKDVTIRTKSLKHYVQVLREAKSGGFSGKVIMDHPAGGKPVTIMSFGPKSSGKYKTNFNFGEIGRAFKPVTPLAAA